MLLEKSSTVGGMIWLNAKHSCCYHFKIIIVGVPLPAIVNKMQLVA